MQAGMVGRMAQCHDLGGEPGNQRVRAECGPREQDAHDQVGGGELEQVNPQLSGGQDHSRLQGQHQRRDHEQAWHAPRGDLADQRGEPGGDQPGQQASVAAVQPGPDGEGADRKAGRLDQAPADGPQQPQRPGELQVVWHAASLGGCHRTGGGSRAIHSHLLEVPSMAPGNSTSARFAGARGAARLDAAELSAAHTAVDGVAGTPVVRDVLQAVVSALVAETGRTQLDVVDAGGGTGGFAVPLASQGHAVTVIDPSPDSLAAAQRRAAEAGVPLRAVQGDAADLAVVAGEKSADLVLCHSVLEYVDSPRAAMAAIAAVLRPGGAVSVLAASAVAAVIHRALAGRFDEARRLLAGLGSAASADGSAPAAEGHGQPGPRRFTLAGVTALIEEAGLRPGPALGVRVFADLMPRVVADADPGAAKALQGLELAAAAHPAFHDFAAQVHVLGYR